MLDVQVAHGSSDPQNVMILTGVTRDKALRFDIILATLAEVPNHDCKQTLVDTCIRVPEQCITDTSSVIWEGGAWRL